MKLKSGVFLDFDGVLFDTVKEAYVTCLFCTCKINAIDEVKYESSDFKIFKKYRYLITQAWNYFYLLKIIKSINDGDEKSIEAEYLSSIAEAKAPDYREFEIKFLETRRRLKTEYEEFWLTLNTPYNFLSDIADFINKHTDKFFIITTKDIDTVSKLLKINIQSFNLRNIYDKTYFDKFKTKSAVIRNIMKEYSMEDAIFVDDSIFHVSDCDDLNGLKIFQPEWGYVKPGSKAFSEKDIVIQIKNLLEGV